MYGACYPGSGHPDSELLEIMKSETCRLNHSAGFVLMPPCKPLFKRQGESRYLRNGVEVGTGKCGNSNSKNDSLPCMGAAFLPFVRGNDTLIRYINHKRRTESRCG